VDSAGKFISQRTRPELARVATELTADQLILTSPGVAPLVLPHPDAASTAAQILSPEAASDAPGMAVKIWNDSAFAIDEGAAAAEWISTVLGVPARVVRVSDASDRLADARYAGDHPPPLAFADGFPLLVCNADSLAELNRRMPEPIPMTRFRPNLVVSGWSAFAEDDIDTLEIGPVTLRLVKPCARCVITSIDQHTGVASTNPLPVLRRFRFDRELRGVTFGSNAIVTKGAPSILSRGMRVHSRPQNEP
jgi:uncharacterized protein